MPTGTPGEFKAKDAPAKPPKETKVSPPQAKTPPSQKQTKVAAARQTSTVVGSARRDKPAERKGVVSIFSSCGQTKQRCFRSS